MAVQGQHILFPHAHTSMKLTPSSLPAMCLLLLIIIIMICLPIPSLCCSATFYFSLYGAPMHTRCTHHGPLWLLSTYSTRPMLFHIRAIPFVPAEYRPHAGEKMIRYRLGRSRGQRAMCEGCAALLLPPPFIDSHVHWRDISNRHRMMLDGQPYSMLQRERLETCIPLVALENRLIKHEARYVCKG